MSKSVLFLTFFLVAHTGHGADERRYSCQISGTEQATLSCHGQGISQRVVITVSDALKTLFKRRTQYQRVEQALSGNLLKEVAVEPRVFNRDGREFSFLVARIKGSQGVKILISAARMEADGWVERPEELVKRLAQEFQWVISKANTSPKRKGNPVIRNLSAASIHSNREIKKMSPALRVEALEALLENYLVTVDGHGSLIGQPYYQMGANNLVEADQLDSTVKFYDIRIRQALQLIVEGDWFWEKTPKAVRSLLNGKVWQVCMAKIDERDWATRTRVTPKEKSVLVGVKEKKVQPAKVLVNYHRSLSPGEKFYFETAGLPHGGLVCGNFGEGYRLGNSHPNR